MPVTLFLGASALELVADHVVGSRPPAPEHEWAVDDLIFLFSRFGPQVRLRVAAPLAEGHRVALAAAGARYGCMWDLLAEEGDDALAQALTEAGLSPPLARHLAACAAHKVPLAVEAVAPEPAVRDQVHRICGVYLVDPMQCLSHLHALAMGRGRL